MDFFSNVERQVARKIASPDASLKLSLKHFRIFLVTIESFVSGKQIMLFSSLISIFKFRDFMNTLRNFAKFVFACVSRNLNISRKNLY